MAPLNVSFLSVKFFSQASFIAILTSIGINIFMISQLCLEGIFDPPVFILVPYLIVFSTALTISYLAYYNILQKRTLDKLQ